MGIEKALGMLRERLAQPPLVAGSAIEWSEIRHAGAREELGGFVRQYERVRAAVSTRGENGRNGREEEGKRNGEEESGCSRIAAVRQEEEKRPIEALWRHMQRKMAGFILREIWATQAFVKEFCLPKGNGEKTRVQTKAKRWVAELHTLAQPWIKALTRAVRIPAIERLADFIQSAEEVQTEDTRAIVYARFSLDGTKAVYIGETEFWRRRQEQHFTGTVRHSREYHACSGKGCGGHARYVAHRAARPHTWFTVPLAVCASKREAVRMERRLIRTLRPKLNMEEKRRTGRNSQPTYKEEMRKQNRAERTRRRPGVPPWRNPLRRVLRLRGGSSTERQSRFGFTWFWREGEARKCCNLGTILRETEESMVGESMNLVVCYRMGSEDVSNWRYLRMRFAHWDIATHTGETMSFSNGVAAIRHGEDHGSFTVTARRSNSTPFEEPSSAAFLLASSAWFVRTEDASSADFFRDVGKEVCNLTEKEMSALWKRGNYLDKSTWLQMRRVLWKEYETRYEGLTRDTIEVRLPFVPGIDARPLRAYLDELVRRQPWPEHIIEWHCQRIKIVTVRQKNIIERLSNVSDPKRPQRCACQAIQQRLTSFGFEPLPMAEGHIFCIGREYNGPHAEVLRRSNKNVPIPTERDMRVAWDKALGSLPASVREAGRDRDWKKVLAETLAETDETCVPCEDAVTSNQVSQVKSVLRGSVIGWLDKNVGECFVTCPVTYEKTLDALFNTSNGNYTRMYPLKDTSYKRKKHGAEDLLKNMTTEDRSRVRANQLSTDGTLDATLISAWR